MTLQERIAELEHAAALAELAEETAAHELTREAVKAAVDEWNDVSAALGLATARIRELEEERDELLWLSTASEAERDLCANAGYEHAHTEVPARACSYGRDIKCWWHRRRAIVARIEKATK